MNTNNPISLKNIEKNFADFQALNQLTLDVRAGESMALVGPNGAGKSTLLKICLGLISASSGEVKILEHSPQSNQFHKVKRKIGFLPEQVLFQNSMTGEEILNFYARLKNVEIEKNQEILAQVQLAEAAKKQVSTYSKGMRQRLGLAQAMIGSPSILLLDEPTSGLDPHARQNLFSIINQEKQRGVAIIISSHILTELEAQTDRVAILNHGCLKALGSLNELRTNLNLNSKINLKVTNEQRHKLIQHFNDRYDTSSWLEDRVTFHGSSTEKSKILHELITHSLKFEDIDIVAPSLEKIFAIHTQTDTDNESNLDYHK